MSSIHFDLKPLRPSDIPAPDSPAFTAFLDERFTYAQRLIESTAQWHDGGTKHGGQVRILDLPSSSSYSSVRKELGVSEYWCARSSAHTLADIPGRSGEGGDAGAAATTASLYDRFRTGLLEYHSEHEREYIEACRETHRLHTYVNQSAEVWRLRYQTPAPSSPRTFVVLLLSREVSAGPEGQRCFINISFPFDHPDCPEKQGEERPRVRGRYVSVERVREDEAGGVEWIMATSSDAGGNIPRFITNASLAGSISEDVPSFLKWLGKRDA